MKSIAAYAPEFLGYTNSILAIVIEQYTWPDMSFITSSIHNKYRKSCNLFSNVILHTEMRFSSFLSGGFLTAIVVNPPERNLAKRTSVHWADGTNDSLTKCRIYYFFIELQK